MSRVAKVRHYMATDLVTLRPETEILRAVRTLLANDIGAAPVVDGAGNLVGILTERDCMRVVLNAGYHSEYGGRVAEFMSEGVETLDAEDSIVDAAKLFFGQNFRRYPVLDDGQLAGQISRRDVMRALEELW
ncbi:MAG: CBS domain-containing protein [Gammaproteobacteria bacterium]|nr:CBS domain-containing protein [Gammaproteobacteria bacterium]